MKRNSNLFLVVLFMLMNWTVLSAQTTLGGVNLGNLSNYLFVFTDARNDANWQAASKGFAGDVAIDGIQANERTSGSFGYSGTIYTNASSLGAWQSIVNNNGSARGIMGETARIANLTTDLENAFTQINALPVSTGYTARSSTSLDGLNTQNGVSETFVINVTSGFSVSSKINITGDVGDVYILRWDNSGTLSDGYQGAVKFSSGGAIVPLGGLKPTNFIHVAGDLNSSGGGSTPSAPYPQGPCTNDGTGALVNNASNFSGGGFFTGYWLTTGSPENTDAGQPYGKQSSLSNGIFVGGWFSKNTQFSMTSGTSGVYVSPPRGCIGDFTFCDNNSNGIFDNGDTPQSGVQVQLCNASNVVIATATTGTQGKYLFTNLVAGTYIVKFPTTITGGKTISTPNPITVPLAAGQIVLTADGGYKPPVVLGSIGDFTFCDNNSNGIFDNGDTPQSNVQVQLCNASNVVIATATTDAQGKYLFPNLAAATYVVKFPAVLADGKTITTPNPITVPLAQGQIVLTADGGYKPPVQTCPDGSPKKTVGSTCNDNNPNTTNDVIQADGCTCQGTPSGPDICTNPTANVVANGTSITITGITTSAAIVQVFNSVWVPVFNQQVTGSTITIPNLPSGTYVVKVTVLGAGGTWPAVCEKTVTITIGGGNNTCPDGSPKKTVGSSCNDNNPNTTNDVIQADGCSCAGTPVVVIDCNAPRDNSINKSCVAGKPSLTGTALAGYEYMWLSSTSACPSDGSQAIAGATGQNYTLPSVVSQTTYFSRCARPIGCTTWGAITESNCLTVTPADCGVAAGGCEAISVVGNSNGTISITGLGTFTSQIQVFNSQWQPVVNQQYNQASVSVPVKNGTYIVKVQLYNTNGTWVFVCEKQFTGITTSGGLALLSNSAPILELAAAAELHHVKLGWANNTGDKNDFFDVEKLNQTSGDFEKIALINSQNGDKLEYYTAFDNAPTEGDNTYRISLTGTDGTKKVSNISTVKFAKINDFRIFPNPAVDYIDVDLKQYEGKAVTLQVYDSFGKLVLTQNVEKASSTPVQMDLNQTTNGQYLLRVTSDGRKASMRKFIMQH